MNKYTITPKRRRRDIKQMNIDKRIDILIKRNNDWSFGQIADYYKQSRQSVVDIYNKIKDMTVQELEELRQL